MQARACELGAHAGGGLELGVVMRVSATLVAALEMAERWLATEAERALMHEFTAAGGVAQSWSTRVVEATRGQGPDDQFKV